MSSWKLYEPRGVGTIPKSCQLFQLVCVHYRKGECSSGKCICWRCCLDGPGRCLLKPQVLRLGQWRATAGWQHPGRVGSSGAGGGVLQAAPLAVRTRLLAPPPLPPGLVGMSSSVRAHAGGQWGSLGIQGPQNEITNNYCSPCACSNEAVRPTVLRAHFTEDTEAQRGGVTCPQSQQIEEPGLKLRPPGAHPRLCATHSCLPLPVSGAEVAASAGSGQDRGTDKSPICRLRLLLQIT